MVIMLSFCICGCEKSIEKEILGKWEYSEKFGDNTITISMTFKKQSMEMEVAIKELGEPQCAEGVYEINEEDQTIFIVGENGTESTVSYKYIDGELCVLPLDDESIVLKKVK